MNEPKASPRSVEVVFAVASSVETASLPSGDELQIIGYLQQTFRSVAIRIQGGVSSSIQVVRGKHYGMPALMMWRPVSSVPKSMRGRVLRMWAPNGHLFDRCET
jgi:hypothetical protein